MGCDIHTYVEQQCADGSWERVLWRGIEDNDYETAGPFDWRTYPMFGFLADVRNAWELPVIAQPRGLPEDATDFVRQRVIEEGPGGSHDHSWLSVNELNTYDYDVSVWHRPLRPTPPQPRTGPVVREPWQPYELTTLRAVLGDSFFADLAELTAMNENRPTRVVFYFDN